MAPIESASVPAATPHLATSEVQFRRILLAIDFSAQTHQVITAAVQVAKEFHSELFLVHATEPVIYGTGAEPIAINTYDLKLDIAQARMTELVNNEPQLASVPHKEIVAYAGPIDLMEEVIRDKKIDLVIAGSHGARGIERLALGSVAECILRTVRCPVLVIGPHAILSSNIFSSLVLAAGLTPGELRSAQYATALAERFRGKLTLVHVVQPKKHKTGRVDVPDGQIREELQELIARNFAAHAMAACLVEHGEAGETIATVARDAHGTMIVTGAREESVLADRSPRATLAKVIRSSPCPVLCIRGHAA